MWSRCLKPLFQNQRQPPSHSVVFVFSKNTSTPRSKSCISQDPFGLFLFQKFYWIFSPLPSSEKQRKITHSPREHFSKTFPPPSRKGRYRIFNKKLDKVRELVSNLRVLDKNCLEILQIFPELTFSEWSENPWQTQILFKASQGLLLKTWTLENVFSQVPWANWFSTMFCIFIHTFTNIHCFLSETTCFYSFTIRFDSFASRFSAHVPFFSYISRFYSFLLVYQSFLPVSAHLPVVSIRLPVVSCFSACVPPTLNLIMSGNFLEIFVNNNILFL